MSGEATMPGTVKGATAPLCSMRGIGKAFSGVRVLEDVCFDLRPGEVHVLAGENGAGKSTLVKILAGIHTEFEGEVRLAGEPIRFRTPQEAASRGISVIHQELSLIGPMSVLDNLFLGRELARRGRFLDRRAELVRASEVLARLGLEVELDTPVERYPIGVQQQIEIAKALVFEARIFVMDEPTSALGEAEVKRLFALVRALRAEGCGIVFISHRMEEIYAIGDRVTVLRDGRRVGTAPLREISPSELIRWMVGREIRTQFPERRWKPGGEALRVEGLSLEDAARTGRLALDGVSFSVRAGEVLGIAGLQGSGKSRLLHALFGSFGPVVRGRVTLFGEPFEIRSPARSIARGIALLTNDRKGTGLVLGMGITENTTLASLRRFSPFGYLRPRLEEAAARRHLAALRIRAASLDREVATLSGGNQQKVALAKWLETGPRVLLLDEPTRGVDVGAKHDIYELMNAWTDRGIAILLITSEMPELLAMSDRILVLHRGRVTASFDRGEASAENVLEAAMGRAA